MGSDMATGLLITKRIILRMLEELSGFFKTLVKLQPLLKLQDHNPAHRKYIQGTHVLES